MVDAFDYIYSPVSGKKVSIHSSEGKRTINGFIMEQRGGSLSNVVKKVKQGAKQGARRVRQGAKRVVGGVGQGAKRVVGGVRKGARRVVKGVKQGARQVVKGAKVAVGLKKGVGRPSSGKTPNKKRMSTVVKNAMGSKSSPRSPACPRKCKNKKPTSGNKKPTTLGGIVRTQIGAPRVSPVPRSCPKNC